MTYNLDNPNEHETLVDIADHAYDAFDEAMTDEPSMFFGCVEIQAYRAIFINDGSGWNMSQYVPEMHGTEAEVNKADGKFLSTQIDFNITPANAGLKMIQRSMGAKNRKRPEFARVVRPSIEALSDEIAKIKSLQSGQFNPLKELSGMWVAGEFVPRPSNKEDETWTTLKFTRVFANQDECIEAMNAHYNNEDYDEPAEEGDDGHNEDKTAMIPFLPPLWEQAEHDRDKMAALLTENPLLNETFTIESPEVVAVMGEGEE